MRYQTTYLFAPLLAKMNNMYFILNLSFKDIWTISVAVSSMPMYFSLVPAYWWYYLVQ